MSLKSLFTSSSSRTSSEDFGARPVPWAFAIGFTLAGLLAASVVRPYGTPLFLGAVLAVTLAPVSRGLSRLFGGRGTLAAALTTVLFLLVVLTPLLSLVAYGANEVHQGIDWLRETVQIDNLRELIGGRIPAPVKSLLEKAFGSFEVSSEDLTAYGKRAVEVAQQAAPKVAGASAAALVATGLMLLSLFFFLADGRKLIDLIMRVSPLRRRHTQELMEEFQSVSSASLLGMAFTAVGQSTVLTLGFAVAGLPHLFFFAVMSLIAAFVPLVGTMLVWLPTVVGLAATGKGGAAAALAAYAVVATNIVDGGLKPMVLQGRMAMHGGLLFLGILGGLVTFGPVGVIAGPLCIAFFTTFLTIYQRDYLHKKPVDQQ